MSVVSVLIATAIVGVTIVGVLAVIDQLTAAIARNNATQTIEAAIRTVQGIVANKDLCDNALRLDSPSQKLQWPVTVGNDPPRTIPVRRIYAQSADNQSADNTMVLRVGGTIAPGYTVSLIELRERRDRDGNATAAARGTLAIGGSGGAAAAIDYSTYSAELVIRITGPNTTHERTIPYNPVVHPTSRFIDKCYQDSSAAYLCEQLGGTYDTANGTCSQALQAVEIDCRTQLSGNSGDCPSADPPNDIRCTNVYYVAGFEHLGTTGETVKPVCRCQRTCWGGGFGARPGTGTSPVGAVGAVGATTTVGGVSGAYSWGN
jgi:hypothetical protein